MSDKQQEGSGCIGWVLEWGVFVLGAVLMFAKTSELLSAFAPKVWFGYTGIEEIYGAVSALMVEGLFVAIKLSNDPILNGRTRSIGQWFTDTVIMVIPFVISALAQPIDAFVIQGRLSELPPEIQLLVSWLVPMIPGLIVGMILVKSRVDSLPPDIMAKFGQFSQGKGGGNFNLGRLDPRTWGRFKGKNKGSVNARSRNEGQKPQNDTQKPQETKKPQNQPQVQVSGSDAEKAIFAVIGMNKSELDAWMDTRDLVGETETRTALREELKVNFSNNQFKKFWLANFPVAERTNGKGS